MDSWGFEPQASPMPRGRSTADLRAHYSIIKESGYIKIYSGYFPIMFIKIFSGRRRTGGGHAGIGAI